jgi:hypothetical protein
MSIVNELFQNLRLLKCYGWGKFDSRYSFLVECAERESQKGSGSQKSRAHEKMNSSGECGRMLLRLSPVSSGWCFSADIRHDESDEYQDLVTFRYSTGDLPLLYSAGGGEIVRF